MTWLVERERSQAELATAFRAEFASQTIVKIPGVHEALAALVAKRIGFRCLYLSGAAYTASRGLPDLGLLHSTEVAHHARDLVRASNLPLLVDIDTGYGGILQLARAGREMVEARVAAVQMEDQQLPKKCGHLNGKTLVSREEMVEKITALKETSPELVIVARTDANAVEGIDAAIQRAQAYQDAGADVIFPEALTTKEEFRQFAQAIRVPLLANLTEFGKTPLWTAEELQALGYRFVLFPVTSLRVAAKAYELVLSEIYATGTQRESLARMQTRSELYDLIDYAAFEALDAKIARTVLPEDDS